MLRAVINMSVASQFYNPRVTSPTSVIHTLHFPLRCTASQYKMIYYKSKHTTSTFSDSPLSSLYACSDVLIYWQQPLQEEASIRISVFEASHLYPCIYCLLMSPN
ncbi:hypothetical protein AMECASPLE_025749 [Ameca splendens]|uniref:Uncharacterized protein n=1 Tax=Ameca splendens TaxID=208324 RepID=A0ABV0XTM0_9TELE